MARRFCLFETTLGWIGLAWNERAITRLLLPQRDREAMAQKLADHGAEAGDPPAFVLEIVSRIRKYANGERVEFDDVAVDFGAAEPFEASIYAALRELRFGETTTYGALARAAGHEGLARETGTALGRNPVPLIVPCHRILAAGNKIGGFSAPGGATTKQRLLDLEGVAVGPPPKAQAAFAF